MQEQLLDMAAALEPKLKKWKTVPVGTVEIVEDKTAWQGYAATPKESMEQFGGRVWDKKEYFILNLGETLVGRLEFAITSPLSHADSPVRLRIIFAEKPLDIAERDLAFNGYLSSAWIQDEIVVVDDLPAKVKMPRRYTARYIYIEVLAASRKVAFKDIIFHAEAAERFAPALSSAADETMRQLDAVAVRTLRNCMQRVFEDGPRRDRRLWLGDIYLQAKINTLTFRRFDIVKRSICLLAAFPDEEGQLASCIYERPSPEPGCHTVDYPLLFAGLLLDYARDSGDLELAEQLYGTAVGQFDYLKKYWNNGRLDTPAGWIFIDWCKELDRQVALEGIYIYGLRRAAELAALLGKKIKAKELEKKANELSESVRAGAFDPKKKLFSSGKERQISYASQIWMILAGVVDAPEAALLLKQLKKSREAVKPVTPYLYHYLLSAHAAAGDFSGLKQEMLNYWGKMADYGADTFWEVFDDSDHKRSPYNEPRLNSNCHAWSCAPAYFIRKYPVLSE